MPRAQKKLSQLIPNKYYSIEGTLKFMHQSESFTTAVIQQQSVQKKIKIPATQINQKHLQEGNNYRFNNCYYTSNGWLLVRPKRSIQAIKPSQDGQKQAFAFSLKQIHQNVESLSTKYFSTFLKVYSVGPKQVLKKNGTDIKYQVLKGYSAGLLIDVTIWNGQIDTQNILNEWVLFQGMRIKKMNDDKYVLVSTVFTKLSVCDWEIDDFFDSKNLGVYENLSQIYKKRTILELKSMAIPQSKIFSIVKAKVKSIVQVDYDGCPKCKRKIQNHCEYCQINTKSVYTYGKVTLQQGDESLEVIVFDEKIKQLFKFAKQNCSIEGKIKTFGRREESEIVISHILTKIDSIFF